MTTLTSVTEVPEREFLEHPEEILHRVVAGEDLVVTVEGRPAVDLSPHRPAVSLADFLGWPKAGRSLLDDIEEFRGADTTDSIRDPWERWA